MAEDAADVAAQAILSEYRSARTKHAPMHSGHEGYAVIREELDELWDEVKKKHPDRNRLLIEAAQVGAMALAFMVEIAAQPEECTCDYGFGGVVRNPSCPIHGDPLAAVHHKE